MLHKRWIKSEKVRRTETYKHTMWICQMTCLYYSGFLPKRIH